MFLSCFIHSFIHLKNKYFFVWIIVSIMKCCYLYCIFQLAIVFRLILSFLFVVLFYQTHGPGSFLVFRVLASIWTEFTIDCGYNCAWAIVGFIHRPCCRTAVAEEWAHPSVVQPLVNESSDLVMQPWVTEPFD